MRISDWSSDVCSSDLAADELDAAVGQVAYAVAGAVQAPVGQSERIRNKAFGGKVGAAEVATRHALPADMQFAYDSRRYRFTAGVQDVDAGVGDREPDRDRCRARRRSEEHTTELQSP